MVNWKHLFPLESKVQNHLATYIFLQPHFWSGLVTLRILGPALNTIKISGVEFKIKWLRIHFNRFVSETIAVEIIMVCHCRRWTEFKIKFGICSWWCNRQGIWRLHSIILSVFHWRCNFFLLFDDIFITVENWQFHLLFIWRESLNWVLYQRVSIDPKCFKKRY